MNDEIKEILEEIDNKIIPNEHWNKIKDYITNLQEENERLKEELQQEKKDFKEANDYCFELKDYKSRCERAIEFCDYLLAHDEVVINRKEYIKQNGDDIITNAIKSKLLGGDEE